jgi:hypothetical protein
MRGTRRASPRSSRSASPRTRRKFKPSQVDFLVSGKPTITNGDQSGDQRDPDTFAATFEKPTTLDLTLKANCRRLRSLRQRRDQASTFRSSRNRRSRTRVVARRSARWSPALSPVPTAVDIHLLGVCRCDPEGAPTDSNPRPSEPVDNWSSGARTIHQIDKTVVKEPTAPPP